LFARYSLKHYTNSGEACQQFNKVIILPSVSLSYDFVSTPSITYSSVFYSVLACIFYRRYSLLAGGLRVFLSQKKPGKRSQKSVWGEIFALVQDGADERHPQTACKQATAAIQSLTQSPQASGSAGGRGMKLCGNGIVTAGILRLTVLNIVALGVSPA